MVDLDAVIWKQTLKLIRYSRMLSKKNLSRTERDAQQIVWSLL